MAWQSSKSAITPSAKGRTTAIESRSAALHLPGQMSHGAARRRGIAPSPARPPRSRVRRATDPSPTTPISMLAVPRSIARSQRK